MLTAAERYRQYRWGILAQACDEAPIGIWEPYWWANNVLRDLSVEDRLEWAERAMLELLGDDLICFFAADPLRPMLGDAAVAAIRGDAWRRIPLEVADVWFEGTPLGDRRMGNAAEAGEWLGEASVAPGWSPQTKDA